MENINLDKDCWLETGSIYNFLRIIENGKIFYQLETRIKKENHIVLKEIEISFVFSEENGLNVKYNVENEFLKEMIDSFFEKEKEKIKKEILEIENFFKINDILNIDEYDICKKTENGIGDFAFLKTLPNEFEIMYLNKEKNYIITENINVNSSMVSFVTFDFILEELIKKSKKHRLKLLM